MALRHGVQGRRAWGAMPFSIQNTSQGYMRFVFAAWQSPPSLSVCTICGVWPKQVIARLTKSTVEKQPGSLYASMNRFRPTSSIRVCWKNTSSSCPTPQAFGAYFIPIGHFTPHLADASHFPRRATSLFCRLRLPALSQPYEAVVQSSRTPAEALFLTRLSIHRAYADVGISPVQIANPRQIPLCMRVEARSLGPVRFRLQRFSRPVVPFIPPHQRRLRDRMPP